MHFWSTYRRVNISSDGSEVEELEQEEFHADALMRAIGRILFARQ